MENLNNNMQEENDILPITSMVGKQFKHKNGNIYTVLLLTI